MRHWQYAYFNECMTGFEYQAAAHMVQEGAPITGDLESLGTAIEDPGDPRSLTLRGLALTRAIHDRYAPERRNPYNEIECSDHYARAAAGYSVYLAAAGYHHHGPQGELAFAPKIRPEDFKSPFLTAAAWGTFRQLLRPGACTASIVLAHGTLRLARLTLTPGFPPSSATAATGKASLTPALTHHEGRSHLDFTPPLELKQGDQLRIQLA